MRPEFSKSVRTRVANCTAFSNTFRTLFGRAKGHLPVGPSLAPCRRPSSAVGTCVSRQRWGLRPIEGLAQARCFDSCSRAYRRSRPDPPRRGGYPGRAGGRHPVGCPADASRGHTGYDRLRGLLNLTALQKSLDTLVVRHEVLRTTFTSTNKGPIQIVGH